MKQLNRQHDQNALALISNYLFSLRSTETTVLHALQLM